MPYVPPFKLLRERVYLESVDGVLRVTADYKAFLLIIRDVLRGVPVDEEWYFKQYPDVLGSGMSAHEHFAEHGYFEGRLPSALAVDEEWYLANYPDVADQIANGDIPSALIHFRDHGYAEGRLPNAF